MPTQDEIARMEAAAKASKEKREDNASRIEYKDRKEAEARMEAAGKASQEKREKSEYPSHDSRCTMLTQFPLKEN